MKLNIFQYFTPKDKNFYPLFERATANLVETSKILVKLVNTSDENKRKEYVKEIERLEHVGDGITHETFVELSANFITPFDREDIHALIASIDDVVDYIHGSAKRIELYGVTNMTKDMQKLADLIQNTSEELNNAVKELRNLKNIIRIKEALVRINSIENHADDIFDNAIAQLFHNEKNAIELIRIKDVLSAMETATDKAEDAADVISSILVKNA